VLLVPRLNPDGAELAMADKPRHIRSSTRPYPWDEPHVEGLTIEDMDGDGRILMMRIPGSTRRLESESPMNRVCSHLACPASLADSLPCMPEGSCSVTTGVNIKPNRDIEGFDLNRNFPAFWRQT